MPSITIRYLLIGGGALVMLGLLLAAPAFACSATAKAGASPTSGPVGSDVLVYGTQFERNAAVEVRWGGYEGTLLATTATDANGSFRVTVTVPAETVEETGFFTTMPEHPQWAPGGASFTIRAADPDPDPAPDPDPVDQREPDPAPDPNPAPDPDPVDQREPVNEPEPAAPTESQPLGTPSATHATPVQQLAPAPATTATESPSTLSAPSSTTSTADPDAATGEAAPERELVEAAAQTYDPAHKALLAGAGITTSDDSPVPTERPAVDAAPSTTVDDSVGASPLDAHRSPWALVPLMLLASGLLTASGAAVATGVRERVKVKVKVKT